MSYLFSPSLLRFFHTDVPYPVLPEDVREITDNEHEAIMEALLMHGKVLQADDLGAPIAVDRIEDGTDAASVPNTAQS